MSLCNAVALCLSSRFQVAIAAGPQMVYLYNDACATIFGRKHPAAFGRPVAEVWPEVWPIVGPMLQSVLEGGPAVRRDDLLLLLDRGEFREECYFTFSYSPIAEPQGPVTGVLITVIETTAQVLAMRRIAALASLTCVPGDSLMQRLAACRADLPAIAVYLGGAGAAFRRVLGTGSARPRVVPPPDLPERHLAPCPLDWAPRARLGGRSAATQARAWRQLTPSGRPLLVALALNPHQPLDAAYQFFLEQVCALLATMALPGAPTGAVPLTAREREVVRLIGAGCRVKEVAAHLDISVSSVNTYRQRIFRKLGLSSDVALVRYALDQGLGI